MSTFAVTPSFRSSSPEALPLAEPGHGAFADLELLAAGPILAAAAAAERLRAMPGAGVARPLLRIAGEGDALGRMLALRALSASPGRDVEAALVGALGEDALAEHAGWALVERAPARAAIPALAHVVARGGFAAMPAQLALERWGACAGEDVACAIRRALGRCSSEGGWSRLAETLALVNRPPQVRPAPRRSRGGLRVAQVLLRGRVDAELEAAGAGEGGGVVTLLVQLARELGRLDSVERSLILARPRQAEPGDDEPLGPGAAIVRLPFGPDELVPVDAMWEHRAQVEQAVLAAVASARIDVAHLRYADAGTFAAARALRRAGVRTVFTLAPDPHALIARGEREGAVTRDSFAAAEPAQHALFRLRLVHELADRADHVVTLPRAGGRAGLERLLDRPLDPKRTTSVPEGIAIEQIDRALLAAGDRTGPPSVVEELRVAIAAVGEDRLGLPLILSAGRFDPVKGFPRLVEAWASDPELAARFNLILVGGDLGGPSPVEREVIAGIDAAVERHPAARSGLVLLGARSHDDVGSLLALTRRGLAGAVAPGGFYACASAKEEFGVAILEALAAGLAVVAPGGGGPGSYLEQGVTGVLVDTGSVAALRDGLHRAAVLAADEGRAAAAMKLVRERFAIGPVASALADIYRRPGEAR